MILPNLPREANLNALTTVNMKVPRATPNKIPPRTTSGYFVMIKPPSSIVNAHAATSTVNCLIVSAAISRPLEPSVTAPIVSSINVDSDVVNMTTFCQFFAMYLPADTPRTSTPVHTVIRIAIFRSFFCWLSLASKLISLILSSAVFNASIFCENSVSVFLSRLLLISLIPSMLIIALSIPRFLPSVVSCLLPRSISVKSFNVLASIPFPISVTLPLILTLFLLLPSFCPDVASPVTAMVFIDSFIDCSISYIPLSDIKFGLIFLSFDKYALNFMPVLAFGNPYITATIAVIFSSTAAWNDFIAAVILSVTDSLPRAVMISSSCFSTSLSCAIMASEEDVIAVSRTACWDLPPEGVSTGLFVPRDTLLPMNFFFLDLFAIVALLNMLCYLKILQQQKRTAIKLSFNNLNIVNFFLPTVRI